MAAELDHAALAALVAPRTLVIESAREDLIFPLDAARDAVAAASVAYAAAGVPDRLVHIVVDGDHRFDGAAALPALVESLYSTS
jgi:hypothetical protein